MIFFSWWKSDGCPRFYLASISAFMWANRAAHRVRETMRGSEYSSSDGFWRERRVLRCLYLAQKCTPVEPWARGLNRICEFGQFSGTRRVITLFALFWLLNPYQCTKAVPCVRFVHTIDFSRPPSFCGLVAPPVWAKMMFLEGHFFLKSLGGMYNETYRIYRFIRPWPTSLSTIKFRSILPIHSHIRGIAESVNPWRTWNFSLREYPEL